MTAVSQIGAAHAAKIVEVLQELLEAAKAGQLVSLALLAEYVGQHEAVPVIVGRYRSDLARLLGELSVMNARLAQHAATSRQQRRGFRNSHF